MTVEQLSKRLEELDQKAIDIELEINLVLDQFLEEFPLKKGDGVILDGEYIGEVRIIHFVDNDPIVEVWTAPADDDADAIRRVRYFHKEDIPRLEKTEPRKYKSKNCRKIKWFKYPENKPSCSYEFLIIIRGVDDKLRMECCQYDVANNKFKFYTDQKRILYWSDKPELPDELLD